MGRIDRKEDRDGIAERIRALARPEPIRNEIDHKGNDMTDHSTNARGGGASLLALAFAGLAAYAGYRAIDAERRAKDPNAKPLKDHIVDTARSDLRKARDKVDHCLEKASDCMEKASDNLRAFGERVEKRAEEMKDRAKDGASAAARDAADAADRTADAIDRSNA